MWQLPLHYSFPVTFSFQSEVIIIMTVRAASAAASAAARHVLVLCHKSHLCPHWNSLGGLRCGSFFTPFNSSFSPRCNSGGDLCPLEKGTNLWVLPSAVLSFVNEACKMKDCHYSYKIPRAVFLHSWAGWCPHVSGACQKQLCYKYSGSFLPEPLKHHPLKEKPDFHFRTHLNCFNFYLSHCW